MLERFEADPGLGLAGGALTERSDGEWKAVPTPEDHATGLARIYRRECFEKIGGIPERLGSDPIAVTYGRMNGYSARTFDDLPVRHLRPMGSRQGILHGRARHGATHYIVGYGLAWAVLRSLLLAVRSRPPLLGGAAFLFGYLRAALGPTEQVRDESFREFTRREQRHRLLGAARRRIGAVAGEGAPAAAPAAEPGVEPAALAPGASARDAAGAEGARRVRILDVLRTIEDYGDHHDWTGTDPYEGLNATRLVTPLKRTFRGRQLVIQAVKRSPLDLRPLLGIEPALNAATISWVISSYARDGFLPESTAASRLEKSVRALRALRCEGFEEPCWGYHFDTQSRVFFYPRTAPNTIATAFAANALSTPTSAPAMRSCSPKHGAPDTSSCATSTRPRPTAAPTSATSSATGHRSRTPTPTSARCSPGCFGMAPGRSSASRPWPGSSTRSPASARTAPGSTARSAPTSPGSTATTRLRARLAAGLRRRRPRRAPARGDQPRARVLSP